MISANFTIIHTLIRAHAFDKLANTQQQEELDKACKDLVKIEIKLRAIVNKLSLEADDPQDIDTTKDERHIAEEEKREIDANVHIDN